MEKLTVSVRQAAQATGLSEQTIRRKIDAGELESAKVDRRVLVGFESLQRLVSTKGGDANQ